MGNCRIPYSLRCQSVDHQNISITISGMLYCILSGQEDSGGKSWFHGENHFVAFLIRRCMDVVRGLSRRLRSRDWLVLIHDGSGGSRSSGICVSAVEQMAIDNKLLANSDELSINEAASDPPSDPSSDPPSDPPRQRVRVRVISSLILLF